MPCGAISGTLGSGLPESFSDLSAPFYRHFRAAPVSIAWCADVLRCLGRSKAIFANSRHRLYLVATDLDAGGAVQNSVPADTGMSDLDGMCRPVPPRPGCSRRWQSAAGSRLMKRADPETCARLGLRCAKARGLVLCINPLVPFDPVWPNWRDPPTTRHQRRCHLVEGGLPVDAVRQTFETIIRSRMRVNS